MLGGPDFFLVVLAGSVPSFVRGFFRLGQPIVVNAGFLILTVTKPGGGWGVTISWSRDPSSPSLSTPFYQSRVTTSLSVKTDHIHTASSNHNWAALFLRHVYQR